MSVLRPAPAALICLIAPPAMGQSGFADLDKATAFKRVYAKAKAGDVWAMLWLNKELWALKCEDVFFADDILPILNQLADQGNSRAQMSLAFMMFDYQNPSETAKGMALLEKAAAQNDPVAMLKLSALLDTGDWGITKDPVRAQDLAKKSLEILKAKGEAGDGEALYLAAKSVRFIPFLSNDERRAMRIRAADLGNIEAICATVQMDCESRDPEEYNRVARYLKTAAAAGEWRAVLSLAQRLDKGDCLGIPWDPQKAVEYYVKFEELTGSDELIKEIEEENEADAAEQAKEEKALKKKASQAKAAQKTNQAKTAKKVIKKAPNA